MSRQFLANLSFLIILNFLVKPIYIFGIEVSVQNRLGAVTYGLYFAILNAGYLLQILNDFGLQIYNNREVALNPTHIAAAFKRILGLKAMLSLTFILAFIALTFSLGYGEYLTIAIPVGINLVLISLVLFLRSNVSGLGFYRWDSVLSIMDKAILIILCGYLLWFSDTEFTIYSFVYAQMVSLGMTALFAGGVIFSKASTPSASHSSSELPKLLKDALPFALSVFLMTLYTRIDAVMIEQIAPDGDYQSGLYAAGYRLLDAANMFAYLFAVLLLPMFSKLLDNRGETVELIGQSMRIMWFFTITAVALALGFKDDIIDFLYSEATTAWIETFGLLFASFIPIGLMYVFGTYMTARGEMRTMNLLYASCVLVNITINFALIPRLGAKGAAIATLITQSFVTLMLIGLCHTRLNLSLKVWGRPIIYAIAAFGLLYLLRVADLKVPWIVVASVFSIALLGIAFLTRLIKRYDIEAIITRRGG